MPKKLKQGLCTNLEGWDGEGDGREVQKGGDICIPMAGFACVFKTILQLVFVSSACVL